MLTVATMTPNPVYLYKKFYGSVQAIKIATFQTFALSAVALAPNPTINTQQYNL